jgi:predicted transcriptional regulator
MEMDIAVLQALSASKPLKLTHIMYKSNMNAIILKAKLTALEERGLVVSQKLCKENLKRFRRERRFYGLTPRGHEVLHSCLSAYNALGNC